MTDSATALREDDRSGDAGGLCPLKSHQTTSSSSSPSHPDSSSSAQICLRLLLPHALRPYIYREMTLRVCDVEDLAYGLLAFSGCNGKE